jgi:hypothetical protein
MLPAADIPGSDRLRSSAIGGLNDHHITAKGTARMHQAAA